MIINSNSIIECDAWKKLSDCHYEGGNLPRQGLIHCEVKHLYEFIKKCGQEDKAGPYVLITSDEDYGLVYQERHPVWRDALKYVAMRHFRDKLGVDSVTSDAYNDIIIPARCDVRHCDVSHRLSFKSYAHTELTLDRLPNNIKHWFAVNSAVEEDFVTALPLGVQRGQAKLLEKVGQDKKGLLYVNFSLYTKSRLDAFNYFCLKDYEWATVVKDQGRTEGEFLEDIAAHDFVLCPQGNGVDTYRLWQTLYLGSIPIVNSTMQQKFFRELPILWCDDLDAVQPGPLGSIKEIASEAAGSFDKARLSYWATQIANEVREAVRGG